MALASIDVCRDLFVCPRCREALLFDGEYRCPNSSCALSTRSFSTLGDVPLLVDFQTSVLDESEVLVSGGAAQILREPPSMAAKRKLARLLHPANEQARRTVDRVLELLGGADTPRVLVVGGGAIGEGTDRLYEHPGVEVIGFDIYRSPNVQFVADAHQIPMASESVDAVVVQAVLEHVLEPQRVAEEIHRMLKPEGFVYADTPFLQQVHDGPYDFTRFTESGHRYLFRRFDCLESGMVAGPGTQLAWSVDYFVRALTRSRNAGLIARLAVFWLGYFERFMDPKYALDGASAVYFLGRKSDRTVTGREMVAYYQGGQ